MPPLNLNCVVPREQHSLASPGILGPPRAVLPTELHQAIQCFASSGPTALRFAETTEGFSAELQWPTGTPTKPFLAVPPPLLTLIDDLKLSRPFWSIDIANDILSCSLSWPNRAGPSTPATSKSVPVTPPHSPANDSGYSSPPPSSPLSPPRSRLTFAEAALGAPAAAPSIPSKLPRTLTNASTPKPPVSHQSSAKTTTCSSTQTEDEKPKTTKLKSSSSQTSCPTTNSNTTQTTTLEPAPDKSTQTKKAQLQSSSSQSATTTTSSTGTQTNVLSNTKPSSSQTDLPTCKLCFEADLNPDMTFLHLLQCPGHKSADIFMDRFVQQWASAASVGTVALRHIVGIAAVLANDLVDPPPSLNPLVSPCLDLLASLFPEDDGFESELGCLFADILVDTPMTFADPDDPQVNDILCRSPPDLNASNNSNNESLINNNQLEFADGASDVGARDSEDDVAYPDDDWTNFSDYDGDCFDDDGYAAYEEY